MKRKLNRYRKKDLEPYTFPGTDAAVFHIRKKVTEKQVQELCDTLTHVQLRYYPTAKGWDVKVPWWSIAGTELEGHFKRQKRGWDHEHCSFCHAGIRIGAKCFTYEHKKGGYSIFCLKCYADLKQ